MPDNTLSTLDMIRKKVRRLTRSLSEDQLSTSDLDQYINTFVLYDFPESLRLFNLKTTLTFFTEPYVDTYSTNTTVTTDPLYNFKNKYTTVNPPVYIAGYQALFSQSRDQFFGIYPMINTIASIGTEGDGVTTAYSGYINALQPTSVQSGSSGLLLRNNVLFNSIDSSGNAVTLIDYPVSNTTGALGIPGIPESLPSPYGQIDYTTGQFSLVFPSAPAAGAIINSQTVIVQPTLPQSMLFYDGTFTLRPVPDQAYRINIEAFVRPTELLTGSQEPELAEWWQYISYGTAKKIFEDRMDIESVSMIMPEFKQQERLIQRKTIVQYTTDRASTIYTQNEAGRYGGGWFSGGSLF